jgi:hypothetical protein
LRSLPICDRHLPDDRKIRPMGMLNYPLFVALY